MTIIPSQQYSPSAVSDCFHLVADSFAHEEGGDVEWQDILQEQFVDILHGLHLLTLCLETVIQ